MNEVQYENLFCVFFFLFNVDTVTGRRRGVKGRGSAYLVYEDFFPRLS